MRPGQPMPALALLLPWLAIVSGQQRFLSQPRDLVASLGARVSHCSFIFIFITACERSERKGGVESAIQT